ncbi:hypothetical protein BC628DRAFT_174176 [Trametes gibbosa]|nr:hypothetical protein BC628DRAFT_174176 [Trametes gibbosa]
MYLHCLATLLEGSPQLAALLTYKDLQMFCDIVRWLREEIAATQPSWITTPPEALSIKVHNFLMCTLSITDEATKVAWSNFRGLAWEMSVATPDLDVQLRAYTLLLMFLRLYAWDGDHLHP